MTSTRIPGRLPAGVSPLRYDLRLRVDPRQERFSGEASIRLRVGHATDRIHLHARGISFRSVRVAPASGAPLTGQARAAEGPGTEPGEGEVEILLTGTLPAGEATLTASYDAPFGTQMSGLYRAKEGNDAYAFTQFEAADARRAFPCFDEPGFKVPFRVALEVPDGMGAFSNGPETGRRSSGGWTEVSFAETPPLPTYLVAFAAGPLDVVPWTGGGTVPLRALTARGKGGQAAMALEFSAALLKVLEGYFGRAYPYAKLDVVAVPEFSSGAMENAGLITFREELLLGDPRTTTRQRSRTMANVIAHEIAHQWFGNLVTMAWWDDLWLNESFATWIASKTVDLWRPAYDQRTELLQSRKTAMQTDSLSAARKVRQEVRTVGEANQAFDALTYEKGALVLTMLERWIGEESFRDGVRSYLKAHEWGNATADDLWAALDGTSGQDVSGVARTFLETPGVPLVEVRGVPGAAVLRQEPYRLAGTAGPKEKGHRWKIPVRLGDRPWTVLSGESARVEGVPEGAHPNAGEWSYYRWSVEPSRLRALAQGWKSLDARSRLGVLENAWGMVASGRLGPDVYLETVGQMREATERALLEELLLAPARVNDLWEEEARLPGFASFVRTVAGPHLARLGTEPRAGEPEDDAIVRPHLIHALGYHAKDAAVLDFAATRAQRYLADPSSVPSDLAPTVLSLTARQGGVTFAALWGFLGAARTPDQRLAALSGLATLPPGPAMAQALDGTLKPEFRAQDVLRVIRGALPRAETRRQAFDWFKGNFDKVRARQSEHSFVHIGNLIGVFRTPADRDEARAFFEAHPVPGGDRAIRQGVERADHAIALRQSGAAAVRTYLSRA